MRESFKNAITGVVVAVVVTAAVVLIAQAVGILQALAAVVAVSSVGVGITGLAILQARRSASKSLAKIIDDFHKVGPRALYSRYADSLLELPAAEQAKVFERLVSTRDDIEKSRIDSALKHLRSAEFSNALDRIRSALRVLLDIRD